MGIRISKTVINELVKIKGEAILEQYKLVERHPKTDNHIKKWILLVLEQPKPPVLPSFGTQN